MFKHKSTGKTKIMRTSTVPMTLNILCVGQMKMLRDHGYDVVVVSSPGQELDEIRNREHVRTCAVPMQRRIAIKSDLKSLRDMYHVMRREHPDIVHSMTPKAGLICMVAGKLARVPVRVHTFTGLVWPTSRGLTRHILKWTDRILCACATHIIAEGRGVHDDIVNNRITFRKPRILANGNIRGIDPYLYDRTPEVMAQAEEIRRTDVVTFVFVGRVVADKGITELIDAFLRLHKEFPQTRLILVGRQEPSIDPLPERILDAIASHRSIMAVGGQMDIRPWLVTSDIFVFPSYREGFPNSVLEAGAMSLPSIVTDINGSREIIEDGMNGLIVPPHDTESLYQAMHRLYTDTELRRKMAEAARPHVLKYWHIQTVRQALLDFYAEVKPRKE